MNYVRYQRNYLLSLSYKTKPINYNYSLSPPSANYLKKNRIRMRLAFFFFFNFRANNLKKNTNVKIVKSNECKKMI